MISDCLNFDLVVPAVNCLLKRVFFPVASSLKRVLGFYIFHSLGIKKTDIILNGNITLPSNSLPASGQLGSVILVLLLQLVHCLHPDRF